MRLEVIRPERQTAPIAFEGLVEAVLLLPCQAQTAVRIGEFGRCRDGPAETFDGLGETILPQQGNAEVVVRGGMIGPRGDRAAKAVRGLVGPPALVEHDAELIAG